MKEESNDIVKNLITKSLTGEITPEESQQLNSWRKESSENDALYLELTKTYELAQHQPLPAEIEGLDIEAEWQRFLRSTDQRKVKSLSRQLSQSWLKIAAVVTLLVIAGVTAYNILAPEKMTVIATTNETRSITLPDGSVVDLNRNTTISYSPDFGENNRQVLLDGEAFFNVTPDEANVFSIEVDETKITVLGTSFNVSGYEKANEIEVVVETGLVGFASPKGEVIELSPGEKGVFEKRQNKITESREIDPNYMAWKTRRIVFEESSLNQAIRTINKVYSSNIIINTDNASNCMVTVTFSQQSLDAVLNVLETTLNLTYDRTNDTIEIVDAECE